MDSRPPKSWSVLMIFCAKTGKSATASSPQSPHPVITRQREELSKTEEARIGRNIRSKMPSRAQYFGGSPVFVPVRCPVEPACASQVTQSVADQHARRRDRSVIAKVPMPCSDMRRPSWLARGAWVQLPKDGKHQATSEPRKCRALLARERVSESKRSFAKKKPFVLFTAFGLRQVRR